MTPSTHRAHQNVDRPELIVEFFGQTPVRLDVVWVVVLVGAPRAGVGGQPTGRQSDRRRQRQRAREDTALAVLIHDEVSKDHLVRIDTAEACQWVEDLAVMPHPEGGRKKLWPKGAPMTRLLDGYTSFGATTGGQR